MPEAWKHRLRRVSAGAGQAIRIFNCLARRQLALVIDFFTDSRPLRHHTPRQQKLGRSFPQFARRDARDTGAIRKVGKVRCSVTRGNLHGQVGSSVALLGIAQLGFQKTRISAHHPADAILPYR